MVVKERKSYIYIMNSIYKRTLFKCCVIIISSITLLGLNDVRRPAPEIVVHNIHDLSVSVGQRFMVVTSDPSATDAAYNILKQGGNAVDAAITAQFVLGLTEPQSSGLGGGAFVLYYQNDKDLLVSLDGRETAPFSATTNMFKRDGKLMNFYDAVLSGKSIGVPGTPALLGELYSKYSSIDIHKLIAPAYNMASHGFYISDGLKKSMEADKERLSKNEKSYSYLFNKDNIKNLEYAASLTDFAEKGYESFYQKPLSEKIIEISTENGGNLKQEDFDNYTIKYRKPICGHFQEHKICSMGQPSSGALTMLQILKMIDHNPSWHNYIEASKLAFADRNFYIADPDYVITPGDNLLDDYYLSSRKDLIKDDAILDNPLYGNPPNWNNDDQVSGIDYNESGTTHISIIDAYGNALSMTSTIESAFGSRKMSNGYFLNNELTDFSFSSEVNGNKVANSVQGGKRPRSSMTPTIIFDPITNKPKIIIGTAGGSRIIGYVTQRIIDMLYHEKSIIESISAPHFLSRGAEIEAERETEITKALKSIGHKINFRSLPSGLNGIYIDHQKEQIIGASDPRRIGTAKGE